MSDLINRQAAIEAWCKADCGCKREECHLTYERDGADACAVVRFLQERPAVEPKHGKWEPHIGIGNVALMKCGECGFTYPELLGMMLFNYCPNCGAKMERSEE